ARAARARRRPQRPRRARAHAAAARRPGPVAGAGAVQRHRTDQGAGRRLPHGRTRLRFRPRGPDHRAGYPSMSDSPSGTAPAASNGKRRALLVGSTLAFIAACIAWYLLWTLVWSQREVTEDAYVGGNQVSVSAQVPGTVVAVLVDDTQRVEAGDVLARLDPTDASVALEKA